MAEDADKIVLTLDDMARIQVIASEMRDALVDSLSRAFPDREACAVAVAVALAMLFATSLTDESDQQVDQARTLNEIMARWGSQRLPWRLVPL